LNDTIPNTTAKDYYLVNSKFKIKPKFSVIIVRAFSLRKTIIQE